MNTMQDKQNESNKELDSEEVKRKYMNFKKFELVQGYSDHHYSNSKPSSWQPTVGWAKKIQKEWRILERGLPDMIYVRVYEDRMDLLRAMIIGVEGTPYCDGLFFFDVCFPKDYPTDPPKVYYHSGGLRINPNLYSNGRVCLSLLNTWRGNRNEKWAPGTSTMLQILVSIQGMILNAKPYFNEPGYGFWRGSATGERSSMQYNQQTLAYSLKTMVYTMNKPPQHFEELVIGHFRDRVRGILRSCKDYYTKGVGVKYGVDVTCHSLKLRKEVEGYMKTLAGAFKKIGVEDLEDLMPSMENKTIQLPKEKGTEKNNVLLRKKKGNLTLKILSCFGIKKEM